MINIGKSIHMNNNIEHGRIIFYSNRDRIFYTLSPSGDLYFSIYSRKEETGMVINKFDDYKLFMLADKLYNNIDKHDSKKISIKSDMPTDEFAYDKNYIYNYLDIYKGYNNYLFKFINNDQSHYELCINANNTTYLKAFKTFMNDLALLDDQMTIDEYLYKQKVLEKRK